MPVGIVLRRRPGVTRWAVWSWSAVDVLPGAGEADWRVLREEEGGVTDFHVATPPVIELHGADTEGYVHGLMAQVPSIYVILREADGPPHPLEVVLATMSPPYEAQDYADSGEEIIEKIPMPAPPVLAWVEDFVAAHHHEEGFKKRKRDRKHVDLIEDGVGDARIAQMADVYRSPVQVKKERLQ